MHRTPLIDNHAFLINIYRDLVEYPYKNLPQSVCDGLRHYLRQSKYFKRLTDDALQTKTQNLLSGNYAPDEPIDVFLYPPHDPYAYVNPYTPVDALKTAMYIITNPKIRADLQLLIHDLASNIFTVITNGEPRIYTPTHFILWLDGEPIRVGIEHEHFMSYLNDCSNSFKINMTDAKHLRIVSEFKIVLLNLDKIHNTDFDPIYKPPEPSNYTLPDDIPELTDDNDLSVDDEVANPITDDLLDELNNAFKD